MRFQRVSIAALACALVLGLARADEQRAGSAADQDELEARAFSTERLEERRRKLVKLLGEDSLVLLGSGRSTESDAVSHRANRDFLYLTGIGEPGCFLMIEGEREVVFAPARDKNREVWTGPHVHASEELATRVGAGSARASSGWKDEVKRAIGDRPKKIYVGGLDAEGLEEIKKLAGQIPVDRAAGAIGNLRCVKDEDELALLRRAVEISCAGMIQLAKACGPERFEFEAQAFFEATCRFYGAQAQGYPSIVGSGGNSCILHYSKNRRRMKDGDLLLVDAGAECGGYSADVTRTFPVSGKFTAEQRRVYDAVLRAQQAGIDACVPGKTVREVGEASRAVLRKEGLDKHLPHGVSHWLGLDVHDTGDYSRKLEPGMVLTVEPGVYIRDQDLGVRIEDDILVTDEGPVNLSESCPRTADEMEALVRRGREGNLAFPPLPDKKPLPRLRKPRGKLY